MKITIRKATSDDAEQILALLSPYVKKGILLPRSKEEIEKTSDSFTVAIAQKKIIGVVSQYKYNANLFEIRSLAVDSRYHHKGIGKQLVEHAVNDILQQHKDAKIFCLTYNPSFFKKVGFMAVAKETLPDKIWKDCQYCQHRDNCTETAMVYSLRSRG
ncbi:MAG TPA: N-acetyltransferase [Spirochaetota bacterium]|nr:N-acetyltransferase [Spirochaetota bacterium]HPP51173.1 N-acetyltransferase [Spirochaetota bacterium]